MAPTEDDVATSHPQEIVDPPDVSRSAPSHRSVFLVELVLIAALVAVTLISFRRRDGLPDARVVG